MKVQDVPDEAVFVSDAQQVRAIKKHIGEDAYGFDSFFVIVSDGEYESVWGMCGIIPYFDDEAVQII